MDSPLLDREGDRIDRLESTKTDGELLHLQVCHGASSYKSAACCTPAFHAAFRTQHTALVCGSRILAPPRGPVNAYALLPVSGGNTAPPAGTAAPRRVQCPGPGAGYQGLRRKFVPLPPLWS